MFNTTEMSHLKIMNTGCKMFKLLNVIMCKQKLI